MADAPYYDQPENVKPPSNGLGVAAFVCSLIGVITCGLFGPVGALLGFFGMFKQPRGFAVAGFIIGLIGTLWAAAVGTFFYGLSQNWGGMRDEFNISVLEAFTQEHYAQHGAVPTTQQWDQVISNMPTLWIDPNHVRYDRHADNHATITMAGPDEQFDTADDLSREVVLGPGAAPNVPMPVDANAP